MPPRAKTPPDTRIAALVPVNADGEPLGDAEDWQMPSGPRGGPLALPDDETPPDQSASDRVMALLSNAGDDASAKVQIYRIGQGKTKLVFVDEMSPDEFERGGLKMMSQSYGGGDFEIRLYGTNENNKFCLRSRILVSLENPPKPVQTNANDLTSVLTAMQEQNAQLLRAIADKPAVDPMAQMTQMFTMMKLMREATGDTGRKENSLLETLQLIREMKETSQEVFEPPAPADASPFGMVKEMLPMITAAMQQKPAAPVHVPASIAAPPVSLPSNNQPDPFANIMEIPMLTLGQKIKLRGTLATLLELAKANVDHQEGAALVLDSLPDEMLEVLAGDGWWENFAAIVPSARPFQAWFEMVRNLAVEEWTQDDDDSGEASELVAPAAVEPAPSPAVKLKAAAKPKVEPAPAADKP